MVVHAAVAVVALADVLDLEDLVAAARVDVVDAQADAVRDALVDAEDVVGVGEHVLENVAPHVLVNAVEDALVDAEDVLGVQDVEDLVQAHAHQAVKDHLVLTAMAVLAVLVRVLHVLHAVDVVDVVDVVDAVPVHPIVMGALGVRADVMVAVLVDVRADAVDVQAHAADVQADASDVVDVLAHATDVVMDVVDNAKTHVQQLAQQRVQVPAKLKHSAL